MLLAYPSKRFEPRDTCHLYIIQNVRRDPSRRTLIADTRISAMGCVKSNENAVWFEHKVGWRNQMETFSSVTGPLWGESITGGFPSQRPATLSFDAFFDLRLNKRLSHDIWVTSWLRDFTPTDEIMFNFALHNNLVSYHNTGHRCTFSISVCCQ